MLPYGRQSLDEGDIKAVVESLRSDWLTTGPRVAQFERDFADAAGAKFAVAVSSGTAALHAAVHAAGIGAGDEVVVSPMTFAASANCVLYQGGRPVFVDVQRDSLNIDPALVPQAISPRTRAIIGVDFTGQPCDLDELRDLCRAHRLILIEDACHALGASYRQRKVGSIADMTVFSLHPVKLITTGEGGVVTTDDPEWARKLRNFRNHGITSDHAQRERSGSWFYEMVELGYNYRLTDFQCALGSSQLAKLPEWIQKRSAIARAYDQAFAALPEIATPVTCRDRSSAWHLYVVRLNLDRLTCDRAEVFSALRAELIGVNVHYIPVPWHPYYRQLGYERGGWPVAELEYERLISLPLFPEMTAKDVDDVISAMTKIATSFRR
jgi:perosamine synthetase